MASKIFDYHPRTQRCPVDDLYRQVERRAFERYLQRVQQERPGSPEDDWLEAEAEVCAEHGITPPRHAPRATAGPPPASSKSPP